MIRCLIVDDELPARKELRFLLQQLKDIEVIGEAAYGFEAIELNRKLKPDVIFLDIHMPKMSGIEVAEKIIKEGYAPLIIFVTAFEEFAVEAFEVNAIDYLLKPTAKERLEKSIKRVSHMIYETKNISYGKQIENLINTFNTHKQNKVSKISIYSNGKLIPVDPSEIVYATVEERNTLIISTKGIFEFNNTLSQLEEKLNYQNFFRTHKSFLINLDFIEEIVPWFNSTYLIELKNVEEKIPVSRSKIKDFRTIMNIS
ncbi:LytR/AlgR family response regulator transcription factor [Alkaliphilus sp. B6464]|uniref:LytR/AlgR family response regulator transcription factor n=1 Tax=Alkaliphilus sp. B6464 TaxID=2731219 RepID=UPI001BA643E4|nr:LytTR family DNA-binding domain-containing protein [Alkaliphilus sp. B6464]QUH21474.1 response regulator transcription factor [Alkaliphilus sp. B6464]